MNKPTVEQLKSEHKQMKDLLTQFSKWPDEMCSWLDAGVRARGSSTLLLKKLSEGNLPLKPLSELHKDREACERIICRHWPAFVNSVEVKRIDDAVTQFSAHNDYLAIYDSGDIFYSVEFIEFPCSAFFIVNTLKEFGYDVQPETKTT